MKKCNTFEGMEPRPLYSIGHGTRPLELFVGLLRTFEIEYLIDVRSRPYSRFNPQYNRQALELGLKAAGVCYLFMGDTLGGRPDDPTCYTADGKVDYAEIWNKDFFRTGMERLIKAYRNNVPVAIMCSESKSAECHRTRLIGQALAEVDVPVMHIDETGELKAHVTVMLGLNKGRADVDLFGNRVNATSIKAYR